MTTAWWPATWSTSSCNRGVAPPSRACGAVRACSRAVRPGSGALGPSRSPPTWIRSSWLPRCAVPSPAALVVPLAGGGYVVDTPGLREVGTWGIDPELLAVCFPEFRRFLDQCRFDNCRHLAEPGCAVREAAGQGAFDADRLVSYQRLYAEVSVPSWSSDRRRGR